jgi:dTDP-4-amino-4,6-dideoxygalactose transaminase
MIEYENLRQANLPFMTELQDAFAQVLDSGWYVLGQQVQQFETAFAQYTGGAHCVGVANGLDALTLSLRALELPPGSDVLVASNTYIATILAIVQAGHRPILVEPDLATYNIDPARLQAAITPATKAICITHLYGKSCDMDGVMAFASANGLEVIEDCAQSHGAQFNGKTTGTFGIAGCFSFYPTKNLGCLGDGGAIVTDNAEFAEKLRYWRNYGSKQKYVNVYPGVNSRLDEMQAAFLNVKLKHLDRITAHKRRLADLYFDHLPAALVLPVRQDAEFDVFHIFQIRHPQREALRSFLLERGVKTEVHYPIPPHRQQALQGLVGGEYPIADLIHAQVLSLPISFATTEAEVTEVCRIIAEFPGL